MRNYFEKLNCKVEKYTKKYSKHPKKAALRLALWNILCCFRTMHSDTEHNINKNNDTNISNININTNVIHHRIAILIKGGIGDQIIGCNYAHILSKRYPEIKMDLYIKKVLHDTFIDPLTWNGRVYEEKEKLLEHAYDVVIQLDRYPHILFKESEALPKLQGFIYYINMLQKFKHCFNNFFAYETRFDGMTAAYSSILGKKRIQQADINSFLSIEENFSYNPPVKYTDICERYNISHYNFITVHRGCDTTHTSNSMKLWPMKHYNALIENIKKRFPHIIIVQMGVNSQRCPAMEGIDVNLVGKTSFADVCSLLKYSFLHIDSEGGFVHIRHALNGGRSVVLFGPTSKDFFGYSENINLRSDACPYPCEHIIPEWDQICIKNNSSCPECMYALHPEYVLPFVLSEISHSHM